MAKHRKYSRKRRGQTRNRTGTRKMRGGLVEADREALLGLGFTNDNINYLFEHNQNMTINSFITHRNRMTPQQIMESLMEINDTIDEEAPHPLEPGLNPLEPGPHPLEPGLINGLPLAPDPDPVDEPHQDPLGPDQDQDQDPFGPGSDDVAVEDERIGGRRRRTNKRKTRKSKKTRKNKKRRHS